jgi:hypothetical protein
LFAKGVHPCVWLPSQGSLLRVRYTRNELQCEIEWQGLEYIHGQSPVNLRSRSQLLTTGMQTFDGSAKLCDMGIHAPNADLGGPGVSD